MQINNEMRCPYCNGKALLKDSAIVYGKSFGLIYICENFFLELIYQNIRCEMKQIKSYKLGELAGPGVVFQ